MSSKPDRNATRTRMRFRGSAPPDPSDLPATVRWLRDRELVRDLYTRYAYGVDSVDMDLVRPRHESRAR